MRSWLVVAGHGVVRHGHVMELDARWSANGVLDPRAGDPNADAVAVATNLCSAGIESEFMWHVAQQIPKRRIRAGSGERVPQRRDRISARRERIAKPQAREHAAALRIKSLKENRPAIGATAQRRRQGKAHGVLRRKSHHALYPNRILGASRTGSGEDQQSEDPCQRADV